jgi:hypothetical protein
MKRLLFGIGVALILGNLPVWAADPKVTLESAVREYQEALNTTRADLRLERFKRAQRLFAQVIEGRKIENADLYVNFSNAALQARDIGNAILAYKWALAVQPGHKRARQNLDHARELLPDWVPRPKGQTLFDTFFFWQGTFSRSARSLAAALSFALAGILIALAVRWRWPWARNSAVLPILIWLGLGVLPFWSSDDSGDAVVTASEVTAQSADSGGAPARFSEPLPGGTEVQILERRNPWAHIRLADGRTGWVRTSALTPVGAPKL